MIRGKVMPELKSVPVCLGVLAHVDAGKTTLCESILYQTGAIKKTGRVDHGDTALDTHALERKRGITIFSAQAGFAWAGRRFSLVDTPGHADFSGEMERALGIIDTAVLVISGADGVQAHTETLWRLLASHGIPTLLFISKMDMPAVDRTALLARLREELDPGVTDFSAPGGPDPETLALLDEKSLDRYLEEGTLSDQEIAELIGKRKLFPCWFGSGLRGEGVTEFLDGLVRYLPQAEPKDAFGATVYKISRGEDGRRRTHVRVNGGSLRVRESLRYIGSDGAEQTEKISGLLRWEGPKAVPTETLEAGELGILLGLTQTRAGQGLGASLDCCAPELAPAMTYRLGLPGDVDAVSALSRLRELEEEEPLLHFSWEPQLREIKVQLMGKVQIEILKSLIYQRFGWETVIDGGRVVYRETIAAPVEGAGHFEPLRHYAEVHLLLEPLERGRGLVLKNACSTDQLDINWQRLILSQLAERIPCGVLTGSPVTDLRITLIAGQAHLKHTEGGDFRQAAFRALRQGLMKARSVLLEPWYSFRLELPNALAGRAISDIRSMHGEFNAETGERETVLTGAAPVAAMWDYAAEVAAYSGGRGRFSYAPDSFRPCRDPERIIAEIGYDPESDTENSPDSVFCAHGAGYLVKWDRADEYMHIETGLNRDHTAVPRLRMRRTTVDEKELEAVMEREFGPIRRPMYTKPAGRENAATPPVLRERKEYLVVDGYNVIFAWDELKALAEDRLDLARSRLVEIMVSYHGFTGSEVVLVFDGYAVKDNPGDKQEIGGIRVVYTKKDVSADLYIQELLHDIGKNSDVRVVTSDNLIRLSALGSGIRRTGAAEFGLEVDWIMGQIGDILRRSLQKSHRTALTDAKL